MRWVKHMTASHDDEKLADLIDRYGHAGYGLWWLVVEIVGARLEGGEPEVTYPVSKWSHLLSVRGSHVSQTLSKLAVTHLVTVVRHDDDITVKIPNLLKYRDEYSRKSGHDPDSVRTKEVEQKQKQKQRQNEEENLGASAPTESLFSADPPSPVRPAVPAEPTFEDFWAVWWNKTAKAKTQKRWPSAASRFGAQFLIDAAIADRRRFEGTASWEWRSQMHPTTWLNGKRWEDELPPNGKSSIASMPARSVSTVDRALVKIQKRLANGERPI